MRAAIPSYVFVCVCCVCDDDVVVVRCAPCRRSADQFTVDHPSVPSEGEREGYTYIRSGLTMSSKRHRERILSVDNKIVHEGYNR